MRKYKHWLVLNMMEKSLSDAKELVNELVAYQKEHNANVELYHRNSGTFEHIFCLQSTECYNDLDIPCNSFSNSFYRLTKKPNNIHKGISFEEYLQRYSFE